MISDLRYLRWLLDVGLKDFKIPFVSHRLKVIVETPRSMETSVIDNNSDGFSSFAMIICFQKLYIVILNITLSGIM